MDVRERMIRRVASGLLIAGVAGSAVGRPGAAIAWPILWTAPKSAPPAQAAPHVAYRPTYADPKTRPMYLGGYAGSTYTRRPQAGSAPDGFLLDASRSARPRLFGGPPR